MAELMIDGLHPHPFAIIDPATLPVFRMDQMNTAVFKRTPGGSTVINIFKPLNMRSFDSIKATKI
jgi:hypothetical protein